MKQLSTPAALAPGTVGSQQPHRTLDLLDCHHFRSSGRSDKSGANGTQSSGPSFDLVEQSGGLLLKHGTGSEGAAGEVLKNRDANLVAYVGHL
jgi:hypothetical protein